MPSPISEYAKTSAFASCPAATGVARPVCPHFPDGAHRCGKQRDHVRDAVGHLCTCGYGWMSSTIGNGRMPDSPIPSVVFSAPQIPA